MVGSRLVSGKFGGVGTGMVWCWFMVGLLWLVQGFRAGLG